MPRAKPQHQHRKRRKPHVYLDPSRFTCTACRASFKSAVGLGRHYAQRRDCQPDSDSDADSPVENANLPDPSTSGALSLTIEAPAINSTSIDRPDAVLDAGDAEALDYSPGIGGDTGGDAWMSEPEPEVSNAQSVSRSNTAIPPDPSRIEGLFEEKYPEAGRVIGRGITPFQHISSTPGYKDVKSIHQISEACYPFKDPEEIEMVDWLLHNRLSKASINDFVRTKYVSIILMITPDSLINVLQISA